ncbi:hypothetical protein K443DRAFT_5168 [Laccaria amethystina LaAM-08-1]|uniref:Uncharacterized protein n=1 Tax=Laccaria amethystina LaAM-08-1 TaxID=1095629 RepID=A0A0C9Y6J1_9AGAR|nr:hypothetical protein K443DRAFT_5168 [Laccaria amethystina LaAM-08-1]
MKGKAKVHSGSRTQSYFVACDGWRKDFKTGHLTHAILDNVNNDILAKLMDGHPLEAGTDTNLCSLIVSSHISVEEQNFNRGTGDLVVYGEPE